MKMTSYDKQAVNVSKETKKKGGRPRKENSIQTLAKQHGISKGTVYGRLNRGMSLEKALTAPLSQCQANGKKGAANNREWRRSCKSFHPCSRIQHYPGRVVSYNTAYQRIKRDPEMSLHDACTTPSDPRRKSPLPNYDPKFTIREQFPEGYVNDLLSPHISDREMMQKWVRSNVTLCHHRSILREEDRRRAINPTRTPTS